MTRSRLLTCALFHLISLPCFAAEVGLQITREPRPWSKPLGVPSTRWVGDSLHVSVVVNETAGNVVSNEAPRAVLLESKIVLCYAMEPVKYSEGQPVPSWAGPVGLEFVITDLPRIDHPEIQILRDCHKQL